MLITSLALSLSMLSGKSAIDTCDQGRDTRTGRNIYFTADTSPQCEIGQIELMRRLSKSLVYQDAKIPDDGNFRYEVAFIVETNGKISGGRVLRDNTDHIGKQILKVMESCQWRPANCHGKRVAMLYHYSTILEFRTQ